MPFRTLLLLFFISFQSHAQHASLTHSIDSILQSQVDSNKIPGAVIQIKKEGKVIYEHAYGYAQKQVLVTNYATEISQVLKPMSTNTLFDIASLTKVVGTTTGIMLLVDKGKISVDDPVGKYVPAFNAPDKKTITIRHLLTHTAGLYEWYPMYYRAHTKEETYKLIGELPLHFPVGQQRKYSELGFTILGEIIEIVSGKPLDRFLKEDICIPLGMKHTLYNPIFDARKFEFAATSHGNPYEYRMVHDTSLGFVFKEINPDSWNGWRKYTLVGEVNDGNAAYACGGVSGAAGIFSTVEDIQLIVDMLMNKGRVGQFQFLSEKTIDLFLTQDSFLNGLGWMMDPANSFMKNAPAGSFGHTGFTGTSIAVLPSEDLSVILLINRQNVGLLPTKEYYNVSPVRRAVFECVMQQVIGRR
mgnify:CR=1 FL=1